MLEQILSGINIVILFILAGIHFYWAGGGKWGLNNAIPKNGQDEPIFTPSNGATIFIGVGLLAMSMYYIFNINIIEANWLPSWLLQFAGWFIVILFFMRAIGEFNYIGFFKKTRNNNFARNDTLFYSPLCFYISISTYIVHLL